MIIIQLAFYLKGCGINIAGSVEMSLTVGILKETSEYEFRVSMVPDMIIKAKERGLEVYVEKGAGIRAFFDDVDYVNSGASVLDRREEVISKSDVILTLQRPDPEDITEIRPGTVVIGTIFPARFPDIVSKLAEAHATTFSLELMPRSTRAQMMDVLSSQSSVAGYRAAILAAVNSPRLMPMLTTAAGTVRPARVFVIGAGVAGLMAISTAKRLGARVSAFDVRKSAGEDVRSLGARFIDTSFDAVGAGGYARDLTEEEKAEQLDLLKESVADADIVITAASVPGKIAPKIITKEMVHKMRTGSVLVDLSAESGGNCEITRIGETITENGVRIVGPPNLPSEAPLTSSEMYSRNILSFLELLTDENGNLVDSFSDEILKACLVTLNGEIVYRPQGGGV